jgi:hypothetical protein
VPKMKSTKKNMCPKCNSRNFAKILFGFPKFSKKLEKDLKSGKIFLGGCCIFDDSPQFHCNKCSNEWK